MPSTGVISGPKVRSVPSRTLGKMGLASERITTIDSSTESIWNHLRGRNAALQSGYFHPEFYRAVSRVRDDVELNVIHKNGQPVALFPLQRLSRNVAHPVGGLMNDFHGLIVEPDFSVDFKQVLTLAGVNRFDFHAMVPVKQSKESPKVRQVFEKLPCPYVDLSKGLFEYQSWLSDHSSTVRRQGQKSRAMVRQLGPLRLEMNCRDSQVLETLIEWKRARFQRTRIFDILSVDWTANLLREILATRISASDENERFEGRLSALWAGDQLVAAHFGFVSGNTLHYWFPTYCYEHRRFSPGTEMLRSIIEASHEDNIDRIDFGYGPSPLKDRFANNVCHVDAGCLSLSAFTRMRSWKRYQTRQLVKRVPMKETLKRIIRPLHPNLGRRNFR